MQDIIHSFLRLVTDGKVINEYDPECPTCKEVRFGEIGYQRKKQFLSLGKKVCSVLADHFMIFGLNDPKVVVTINEGGQIGSGDIRLTTSKLGLSFEHHNPRNPWGDIHVYKLGRNDVGAWYPWEALASTVTFAVNVQSVIDGDVRYDRGAHPYQTRTIAESKDRATKEAGNDRANDDG